MRNYTEQVADGYYFNVIESLSIDADDPTKIHVMTNTRIFYPGRELGAIHCYSFGNFGFEDAKTSARNHILDIYTQDQKKVG